MTVKTTAATLFVAAALAGTASTANAQAPELAVGKPAPEIALLSSTGESHDLAALVGDKKALVIFFRGTW